VIDEIVPFAVHKGVVNSHRWFYAHSLVVECFLLPQEGLDVVGTSVVK
jgi:hypothetical protein